MSDSLNSRIGFLAILLPALASCGQGASGAQPEAVVFGGTYVSNNRIGLMPTRIEFNGPRNCIVYTNGMAYAEGAIAPGSRASGPGPGGSAEGLCQRAEGGMEFSSGEGLGGQTMYFRAVDADTFAYQRNGQTVFLSRRPGGAGSAQAMPSPDTPPQEPVASLGLTPRDDGSRPVTVTVNPVTVGTQNTVVQVPVVRMEDRTVQTPRVSVGNGQADIP